ncbi:Serine/threonine-protein phosphatase 7 long form-like protein [Hordeum vulgare]|nr:Serine/threonine-protein phosphatase 7 long form-like protein [Hordeum vulgare]
MTVKMQYAERYTSYYTRAQLLGFVLHFKCKPSTFVHSAVTPLVDRWRPEMHSFHLPCGEMTVTLADWGNFVNKCRKLVGLLGCASYADAYAPADPMPSLASSSHVASSSRVVEEDEEEDKEEDDEEEYEDMASSELPNAIPAQDHCHLDAKDFYELSSTNDCLTSELLVRNVSYELLKLDDTLPYLDHRSGISWDYRGLSFILSLELACTVAFKIGTCVITLVVHYLVHASYISLHRLRGLQ